MAHEGVKHDYHLVNPSIWPLIGSVAAVALALGLVVFMKGLFGLPKGDVALMAVGGAGVLITMAAWWTEVVREANGGDHTPVVSIGLRYGMVLFIVSEVMFFVAWFWIFFEMALFHHARALSPIDGVADAWKGWPPKGIEVVPPFELPLVNTLTLLLSGTTVTWSHHALQQGDRASAKLGLLLTILLGLLFTSIQAYEYNHILRDHLFYSAESANAGLYGSAFFMATGFHGFHVIVGSIFLTVCLVRMMNGGFSPKQHFGFEAASWYWHFVDVVWLFLFTFLYVIFGAGWGALTGLDRRGALLAGLTARSLCCGAGPLFNGFLGVAPLCRACGFPLGKSDSGDGPAVFVIIIVGFVVVFAALITEVAVHPPIWVDLGLWLPLAAGLSLALLRPLKGLMIAIQIHNRAAEHRTGGA